MPRSLTGHMLPLFSENIFNPMNVCYIYCKGKEQLPVREETLLPRMLR